MTFEIEIDGPARSAAVRFRDVVRDGEPWSALRELFCDARVGEGGSVFIDLTGIGQVQLSERDMHSLAQHMAAVQDSVALARVGFLAPERDHIHRLAEHYVSLRPRVPYPLRVFTRAEECEAFLSGEA